MDDSLFQLLLEEDFRMLQVVSTGALYPPVLTTEGFLPPEHLNLQRGHFRSVSIKLSMMRVPFLKSFDCFNQCVINPQQNENCSFTFFTSVYAFLLIVRECNPVRKATRSRLSCCNGLDLHNWNADVNS